MLLKTIIKIFKSLIFLENFDSEFSYIEVLPTDQNSKSQVLY